MKKTRKVLPLIALVAVAAAFAVLAQTTAETGVAEETVSNSNLQLLVLVNQMALSDEQTTALRDALKGILDEHVAVETTIAEQRAAFKHEMIAFDGTSDELEALLETHRTALYDLREAFEDGRDAAIEAIEGTLTYEQGELLLQRMPLLSARMVGSRRLADAEGEACASRTLGRGMGAQFGRSSPMLGHGRAGARFGAPGGSHTGLASQRMAGDARGRFASRQGHGLQILEDLVEVLELKMQ